MTVTLEAQLVRGGGGSVEFDGGRDVGDRQAGMALLTFALGWYMPTAASQWNWPIGLALLGMLCVTAIGYRQSERFAVDGGLLQLMVGQDPPTLDAERARARWRRSGGVSAFPGGCSGSSFGAARSCQSS